MAFNFRKLSIPGLVIIEPEFLHDPRGYFVETFKAPEFEASGLPGTFVQTNHSLSKRNVVRGMHYQLAPAAQGKLVSVVQGVVFDVAVDLRKGSPTYGKWAGVELDADTKGMFYIPEGFAHGFCVLSDEAQVVYYCTGVYSPRLERGLFWNDPAVGIVWPVKEPVLSDKDKALPLFKDAETNFTYGR